MVILRAKQVIGGSICILVSQLFEAINEVIVKASHLTLLQLLIGRFSIQLLIAILWWNIVKPKSALLFVRSDDDDQIEHRHIVNKWYGDHPFILNIWLRGIIFAFVFLSFWYAIVALPLGDMQCIFRFGPFFAAYAAFFFLNETLPNIRILIPCTILLISGTILITQPSFITNIISPDEKVESLPIDGLIAAILAVLFYGTAILLIRTAKTVHFLQLEMSSSLCFFMISIPATIVINMYVLDSQDIFGNVNIMDHDHWSFDIFSIFQMIIVGIFGFGVLSLSVVGYQTGEASMISWIEYIQLPLGYIFQTFIFKDAPNMYESIGAMMVLLGCLLPMIQQIFVYCIKARQYEEINQQDSDEMSLSDIVEEN